MKKALIVLIPVIGIGITLALAFMGIIRIPGITPEKKKALSAAMYGEPKEPDLPVAKAQPKKPSPPVQIEAVKPDVDFGLRTVAKLWNEIEPTKLVEITSTWKDKDLAPILLKMDKSKVSEYLVTLQPARASALTLAIQKEAERGQKG